MLSIFSIGECNKMIKRLSIGKETWWVKTKRIGFNLFPAHWFANGRVIYCSPCMTQAICTIPLNWRTHGFFGNLSGGTMYAGVDMFPMALAFSNIDNNKYMVIDQEGSIRYLRPAKRRLFVHMKFQEGQLDEMRAALETNGKYKLKLVFPLVDINDVEYAIVTKHVHVQCKRSFLAKSRRKN